MFKLENLLSLQVDLGLLGQKSVSQYVNILPQKQVTQPTMGYALGETSKAQRSRLMFWLKLLFDPVHRKAGAGHDAAGSGYVWHTGGSTWRARTGSYPAE